MSAVDMFWAAPPVTRTLTAATIVTSVLVYTSIINPYYVLFWPKAIFSLPPQLWRLVTCFTLSGPQFGMLMDPYFLYTHGSRLETGSPRFTQPGDFFTYIVFVCATIMGINYFWTGATVFTSALIIAFIYTSSQDDRGGQFNLMVVNIPSQWAPVAMIVISFVMSGPAAAKIQTTGLLAAHLYDFLTRLYPEFGGGRNFLKTPQFIKGWFARGEAGVASRAYGTAFTPADRAAQGAARSSGVNVGNVLPESWKSRGSGQRLGGD